MRVEAMRARNVAVSLLLAALCFACGEDAGTAHEGAGHDAHDESLFSSQYGVIRFLRYASVSDERYSKYLHSLLSCENDEANLLEIHLVSV